MARYRFINGQLLDASTGAPLLTDAERDAPLALPTIRSDITPYRSPIDGRLIGSSSERRDDLKRNNCVEYDPAMSPTRGRIKSQKLADRYGLKVSEEYRN